MSKFIFDNSPGLKVLTYTAIQLRLKSPDALCWFMISGVCCKTAEGP